MNKEDFITGILDFDSFNESDFRLLEWATGQMLHTFKDSERAGREAAGWLRRWSQDNDGTLRWGWMDQSELEEQLAEDIAEHLSSEPVIRKMMAEMTGSDEPEMVRSYRLAIAALNDPDIRKILPDVAVPFEWEEYKPISEARIKLLEEPMQTNVIPITPRDHQRLPKQQKWLNQLTEDDDAALRRAANQKWLIDGVLPEQCMASLVGPSSVGKSFVALDMACSIAAGIPWGGLDTSGQGLGVVYVSAEGGNGLRIRKKAWEEYHGIRAVPMRILADSPIIDGNDSHLLAETIAEFNRRITFPVALVIIDTLNRTMAGEENSATSMAAFVRGCQTIMERNNCAILIIHHCGHGETGRARGSSAFYASLDAEISLKEIGKNVIEVFNGKMKDNEPFPPIRLALEKRDLQDLCDAKGRPLTSLVPRKASLMEECSSLSALNDREQMLLEIIQEQTSSGGVPECDRATCRDIFTSQLEGKHSNCRQVFVRALDGLKARGLVKFDKTTIINLQEIVI